MAVIGELGRKYPCRTEGVQIPLDDETTEMKPGEVLEQVIEVDGTLDRQTTREIMLQILFMKHDYPEFVLHYVKVETSRVTVQFSIAPVGATISGASGGISDETRIALGIVTTVLLISLAVLAIIAGLTVLTCAIKEIWWFAPKPKKGNAEVVAIDMESDLPIPNVNITVAGQTKKTGPNGEPAFFKDLIIGTYTVIGADVDGYQPPETGSVTIVWGTVASCTLWYAPDGYVEATHGWLSIATAVATGDIYIEGRIVGEPGYAYVYLEKGDYDVYFGPVQGYITPPMVNLKVRGEKTTSYVAYYSRPEGEWWEKYIKYALIGGGAIIGAAVLIPQIAQAARRPRREPPKGGQS